MKKTQTQTQEKTQILDDIDQKLKESQFNHPQNEVASSQKTDNQCLEKGQEDLNLVQEQRSSHEVGEKVHDAMRRNAHKMRNMKPIDFSNIPTEFYDENDEKVDLSELDPEEPQPNTLPANIHKELREAGVVDVKWTNTKDLPRGQDKDIRALANAVFASFGIDEKADVVCVNSFADNNFLNEPREVNAIMGYLDQYAASPHIGTMTQDFGQTIEGYTPEIKLYHTPSMAYLCVSEPEGQGLEGRYIYAFKRKQDLKLTNTPDDEIENKSNNRLKNRP